MIGKELCYMNRVPNNSCFHILEPFSKTQSDNKYRCYMLFTNAIAWDWKLNAILLLKQDYPIAAIWSNSRIFCHSKQRDTSRLCSEQLSVCALNICNHLVEQVVRKTELESYAFTCGSIEHGQVHRSRHKPSHIRSSQLRCQGPFNLLRKLFFSECHTAITVERKLEHRCSRFFVWIWKPLCAWGPDRWIVLQRNFAMSK